MRRSLTGTYSTARSLPSGSPGFTVTTRDVRLAEFVYDSNNKGAGKLAINATKGAYRFITGEQDKKNYEIKTPYATLGVRRTVLEIVVVPGKGKSKAGRG